MSLLIQMGPLPSPCPWVPAAIADAARRLYAEIETGEKAAEAAEVLCRLYSDARMEGVWNELYKRRSGSFPVNEFVHPARISNASMAAVNRQRACQLRNNGDAVSGDEARLLEAEAELLEAEPDPIDPKWSEQDRAVQIFLTNAYRNALDIRPVFLSDIQSNIKKLGEIAESLRNHAATLQSIGMKDESRQLTEVADNCDEEIESIDPSRNNAAGRNQATHFRPHADDPWIITRERGDPELRTFIVDLSITTISCFGTPLYGTLATVANVVFSRDDITQSKVREMLRGTPGV